MKLYGFSAIAAAAASLLSIASPALAQSSPDVVSRSKSLVPSPPWAKGDQVGMANTLGPGTWMRCAQHLTNAKSRTYEVSHVRSNTMPVSPFGVPLKYKFRATASVPFSKHAFNGEQVTSGEPGAQGTQMDALGHFAFLGEMWKGKGAIPVDTATYYGGFKQSQVKPSAASPLLKLGIENVPPIITSAVLLDAKTHLGGGAPMKPGQLVTTKDIEAMIKAHAVKILSDIGTTFLIFITTPP